MFNISFFKKITYKNIFIKNDCIRLKGNKRKKPICRKKPGLKDENQGASKEHLQQPVLSRPMPEYLCATCDIQQLCLSSTIESKGLLHPEQAEPNKPTGNKQPKKNGAPNIHYTKWGENICEKRQALAASTVEARVKLPEYS